MGRKPFQDLTPLSVIVTCGNRLEYLKKTLPTFLSQKTKFRYSVILSVFADREDTAGYVRRHFGSAIEKGLLKILQTPAEKFNKARAANLAALNTDTPLLLFVDADCGFTKDISLDKIYEEYHQAPEPIMSFCHWGQILMKRSDFIEIGGYDEELGSLWAPDDLDLIARHVSYFKMGFRYLSSQYTYCIVIDSEKAKASKSFSIRYPWILHFRTRTESFKLSDHSHSKFYRRIGGVNGSAEHQLIATIEYFQNHKAEFSPVGLNV